MCGIIVLLEHPTAADIIHNEKLHVFEESFVLVFPRDLDHYLLDIYVGEETALFNLRQMAPCCMYKINEFWS